MEKVHSVLGFAGGQLLVAGGRQQEASFVPALGMSPWHLLLALLGNSHKPSPNTPKKPPQKGKTTGK